MAVHTRKRNGTFLFPLLLRKDDPVCGTNFNVQVAFL